MDPTVFYSLISIFHFHNPCFGFTKDIEVCVLLPKLDAHMLIKMVKERLLLANTTTKLTFHPKLDIRMWCKM